MKSLALFFNLKLTYKLSIVVLLSVLISIVFYGGYFYLHLKKNLEEATQKRVEHALEKVDFDLQSIIKTISQGTGFVHKEENILASLGIINTYMSKELYNKVLIDSEKKDLLEQLLFALKLTQNHEIVIYDKNQELVAFIVKNSNDYVMNYLSYEGSQKFLYTKFETNVEYTKKPFESYPLIPFKHALYYDAGAASSRPVITFHTLGDELLVSAHQDIYDEVAKEITGHVEVSFLVSQNYFLNVSRDLNMQIFLSSQENYRESAVSIFEPFKMRNFKLIRQNGEYITSISIPTDENVIYLVFDVDNYDNVLGFRDDRMQMVLFLTLLLVLLPLMLGYIFTTWLAKPMGHLMMQIEKIAKGDYSKTQTLQTDDELALISRSINRLAITLTRRERQLKISQEKYEHLSHHDPLTNLPNRRLFYMTLEHAIEVAKRNGTKVAVIFLDLDRFKHINDTLGHNIGDELLIEVAQRLRKIVRKSDSVARVGGDEFNILVEGVKGVNDIELVAKKLLEHFEKPFECSLGGEITTTLSIGIAIFPDDSQDAHELIKYADLAMYKTKDLGRDDYSFFSKELSHIIHERKSIIDALKQAIKTEDEFFLAYQPKISVLTGKIVAVEALIRWHSKTLGFITPDRFISLAEETNLIVPIGKWVLEQSCRDFMTLLQEGYALESISVNVSAVQLKNSDMAATLREVLETTKIDPSMLELEITESYISANEKSAIETLQEFRDMGLALAIDDFGTGYSSMSYLHKLPVTKLKIDKSFVDEIETKGSGVAIVKAIIVLAKTFELQITAEGVETKAQLEFLKAQGCDEIQGYYYSKPLTLEDLKNFF